MDENGYAYSYSLVPADALHKPPFPPKPLTGGGMVEVVALADYLERCEQMDNLRTRLRELHSAVGLVRQGLLNNDGNAWPPAREAIQALADALDGAA